MTPADSTDRESHSLLLTRRPANSPANKIMRTKEKEPCASLFTGDVKAALAGGERAIGEIVMATHAGLRGSAHCQTTPTP